MGAALGVWLLPLVSAEAQVWAQRMGARVGAGLARDPIWERRRGEGLGPSLTAGPLPSPQVAPVLAFRGQSGGPPVSGGAAAGCSPRTGSERVRVSEKSKPEYQKQPLFPEEGLHPHLRKRLRAPQPAGNRPAPSSCICLPLCTSVILLDCLLLSFLPMVSFMLLPLCLDRFPGEMQRPVASSTCAEALRSSWWPSHPG